jgi:Flp pilus assembly protein TadG
MSRRSKANQKGQSLVELALVSPVLMMILAGSLHFGLMMRAEQVVTSASRVGARRATQPGGDDGAVQQAVMAHCAEAGLNTQKISVQRKLDTKTSHTTVTVTYQFTSPFETMLVQVAQMATGRSLSPIRQLSASTVMRL